MTKKEFIIECAMRLYSRGEFEAGCCVDEAKDLALELERRGYLNK